MRHIEQKVRQITATDGAHLKLDQNLAFFNIRYRYLNHLQMPCAGNLSRKHFSHGWSSVALHARSFTDFWEAPALKDNGAVAVDKSPPSTVMRSLAAPSTCRKTAVGVNTREALSNTSLVSMNRSKHSAFSLPCTLKPFTADSSTWSKTTAGRSSSVAISNRTLESVSPRTLRAN